MSALDYGLPERPRRRRWVLILVIVAIAIVALGFVAMTRNWIYIGKVVNVQKCENKEAVLITLDNNQSYIWLPETKTLGSVPQRPGGFVAGKTGLPFFCITSTYPLITIPGTAVDSMVSLM